jgi:hypothetical protein
MSQTTTPDGPGHRDDATVRRDTESEPRRPISPSSGPARGPNVVLVVFSSILCVIALAFLVGAAGAAWKGLVDRDSDGYVTLGSTELQTDQYAIVGDLQGGGLRWFYGPSVLGDARVHATSQNDTPLFVGIGRKDDVLRYLSGAGYATVDSFEVRADTTHPGEAPSGPPSTGSIWATATQGTGEQTLLWAPRDGEWSVVFMNADASAGVDVQGDAAAKLPALPWLAGSLLVLAALTGGLGAWGLVRGLRGRPRTA